jgi:hypothetical protein
MRFVGLKKIEITEGTFACRYYFHLTEGSDVLKLSSGTMRVIRRHAI